MYYIYNEKVVSVQMFRKSIESSSNVQWDGDAIELNGFVNTHGYNDIIEAYCIDEEHQNYGANISYGNGYYSIIGSFEEKNEFLKFLDGIYFKNM